MRALAGCNDEVIVHFALPTQTSFRKRYLQKGGHEIKLKFGSVLDSFCQNNLLGNQINLNKDLILDQIDDVTKQYHSERVKVRWLVYFNLLPLSEGTCTVVLRMQRTSSQNLP